MKSILITGCNRGLGLGLVRTLLLHKAAPEHLIATCREPSLAKELQQLGEQHNNLHILQFDVTNFDSYAQLLNGVKSIVQEAGLNVLFNNAGVSTKFTRLQYVKVKQMTDAYVTNTVAPIMLAKTLLPCLKQAADGNAEKPLGAGRAAIVNMSSILGSISRNTDGGFYPYKCSKAALNQATASMAVDLGSEGIMAVAMHPGWVQTDMGGSKAPLDVATSAACIVEFLHAMDERHNGGFYQWDGAQLPY